MTSSNPLSLKIFEPCNAFSCPERLKLNDTVSTVWWILKNFRSHVVDGFNSGSIYKFLKFSYPVTTKVRSQIIFDVFYQWNSLFCGYEYIGGFESEMLGEYECSYVFPTFCVL